jgi:hypothetical protein
MGRSRRFGSGRTGDDIVVDAMRLRIIDSAADPLEVRAILEQQAPCGAILPPDPRVTVSAVGVSAPLAEVAGAPSVRTAFGAAYSGLENAVYVVGGVTPEGETTGPVVRWDLATNRSRFIAPEAAHSPSDRVLGVAYSPLESVLYVLDVVREVRQLDISGGSDRGGHPSSHSPWRRPHPSNWWHGGHGGRHRPPSHFGGRDVARLYLYDIEQGTSVRLASWPYKGLSSGAHLMLLEDGELALVADRRHHVEAFLFEDAGDHLERKGSLTRRGKLAAPPVMGNHDPVMALLHHGRIEYVTLELSSFRERERCDEL